MSFRSCYSIYTYHVIISTFHIQEKYFHRSGSQMLLIFPVFKRVAHFKDVSLFNPSRSCLIPLLEESLSHRQHDRGVCSFQQSHSFHTGCSNAWPHLTPPLSIPTTSKTHIQALNVHHSYATISNI